MAKWQSLNSLIDNLNLMSKMDGQRQCLSLHKWPGTYMDLIASMMTDLKVCKFRVRVALEGSN